MRTTVAVDDELLAAAKRQAQARGVSLGTVVEEALRRELSAVARPPAVEIPVFRGGTGARPGVDLSSNRELAALLDEGRDLDQRR